MATRSRFLLERLLGQRMLELRRASRFRGRPQSIRILGSATIKLFYWTTLVLLGRAGKDTSTAQRIRGNHFALLALPSRRAPQRRSIMEQYGLAETQIKCASTTCISPIFTTPITLPYTAPSMGWPITSWRIIYPTNWGRIELSTVQAQ